MTSACARSPESCFGTRRCLLAGLVWLLGCSLVCAGPAWAVGRYDGPQARAAREQGRVMPLEQLLAQLARQVPGRLLEAELDEEDGLLVYELRWQLADGRRLEIELDARDGRWLKLKGPRLETVFQSRAGGAAGPAPSARDSR